MVPRFLTGEEMEALKFAIGRSEGLRIDECRDEGAIGKHFLADGTEFMYYDTGERRVCFAWILGDEEGFCECFAHEEMHRVLHERIDFLSCCDYDKIARSVEAVEPERQVETREILLEIQG